MGQSCCKHSTGFSENLSDTYVNSNTPMSEVRLNVATSGENSFSYVKSRENDSGSPETAQNYFTRWLSIPYKKSRENDSGSPETAKSLENDSGSPSTAKSLENDSGSPSTATKQHTLERECNTNDWYHILATEDNTSNSKNAATKGNSSVGHNNASFRESVEVDTESPEIAATKGNSSVGHDNASFRESVEVDTGSPEIARLPQYETTNRRGLLITLIRNQFVQDKTLAFSFFKEHLGFDVIECDHTDDKTKSVQVFLDDVKKKVKTNASEYYCLVFLVSCHGDEIGMGLGNKKISMGAIAKQFSNENLKEFTGWPKIFVADCCRGGLDEVEVSKNIEVPGQIPPPLIATQDSDIILVFATTSGKKAWVDKKERQSVLHKYFIETLREKWKSSHLEEMLIFVRNDVVNWIGDTGGKQTAEVITTLTRALTFKRFESK